MLGHKGRGDGRTRITAVVFLSPGTTLTGKPERGTRLYEQVYDLAIIGGGLIGSAIARDAAGRGLTTFLCDEGDIGGAASAATDRVVHGGLHHLGRMNWGPLRVRLRERDILMRSAPHLVRPLTFVLPHHEKLWPPWAVGLGLTAYDWLGGRTLPRARRLDLEGRDADEALHLHFKDGFAFSDCIADDTRLTIANASDAQSRGASINPRLRCVVAERERDRWRLSLESGIDGEWTVVLARMLINAAGGQAGEVLDHVIHTSRHTETRLTRFSQIVVRRDHDSPVGYALPVASGRAVHVLPHEPGFALIGPAVARHEGDAGAVQVSERDVAWLIDVANQVLVEPVMTEDIVQHLAAVIAMPADRSLSNGDHAVVLDSVPGAPPLFTVFGGRLTTHRRIAEEVVDRLARFREVRPPWTAGASLPGGNFPPAKGAAHLGLALRAAYPFLSADTAHRLVATYGTRASTILTGARAFADLGRCFGADLTAAEVDYLRHDEWAMTAEDVLWRRTRLGLHFTQGEADELAAWMGHGASAEA